MIAASKGDLKGMEALLAAGANINLQDKNGKTALSYAMSGNNPKVIARLEKIDHLKTENSIQEKFVQSLLKLLPVIKLLKI